LLKYRLQSPMVDEALKELGIDGAAHKLGANGPLTGMLAAAEAEAPNDEEPSSAEEAVTADKAD